MQADHCVRLIFYVAAASDPFSDSHIRLAGCRHQALVYYELFGTSPAMLIHCQVVSSAGQVRDVDR